MSLLRGVSVLDAVDSRDPVNHPFSFVVVVALCVCVCVCVCCVPVYAVAVLVDSCRG